MIAALAMLSFAALITVIAPALLRYGAWPERAPALAVAAWLAASTSVVAALVLGGLALMISPGRIGHQVADLVRACATGRLKLDEPGPAIIGLVIVVLLSSRIGLATIAELGRTRLLRTEHRQALALVSTYDSRWDTSVVEHPTAAAFSVPGRPARVVLTAGALEVLDDEQIAAVLAHERAHLAGRHHLLLSAAGVIRRIVPWVPLFRDTHGEISRLIELLADDAAARSGRPQRLATALAKLALASVPDAALSASGSGVLIRIRRLLEPPIPLTRTVHIATFALIGLVAVAPAGFVAVAAAAAAFVNHCGTPAGHL